MLYYCRALERNIKSSQDDLAKFQEHAKAAQAISEKIKDFEQKVIKKEAEVRHVFLEQTF